MFDWLEEQYESAKQFVADDPQEAVAEATEKTRELEKTQKQVDALLELLPATHPKYEQLVREREESRGFFHNYVMPAWNELMEYIGVSEGSEMGALPVIAVGGAAAVIAAAYAYTKAAETNLEREKMILNDPSIPAAIKAQALMAGSPLAELANVFTSAKGLLLTGGVLVGGYYVIRVVKKGSRAFGS